ncbi:hypothetical protein AGLY_006855 [Aphis glycines]|uniref:Uncharacterized protein n=1 Tax=Aphis glycines TaxID=307491 RepID=A0A6G0TS50_APHGL|nr:hypothetical protein AGLY_006855 [Aphis glycines]
MSYALQLLKQSTEFNYRARWFPIKKLNILGAFYSSKVSKEELLLVIVNTYWIEITKTVLVITAVYSSIPVGYNHHVEFYVPKCHFNLINKDWNCAEKYRFWNRNPYLNYFKNRNLTGTDTFLHVMIVDNIYIISYYLYRYLTYSTPKNGNVFLSILIVSYSKHLVGCQGENLFFFFLLLEPTTGRGFFRITSSQFYKNLNLRTETEIMVFLNRKETETEILVFFKTEKKTETEILVLLRTSPELKPVYSIRIFVNNSLSSLYPSITIHRRVKFGSNNRYHFISFPVVGEKGGLCFNGLNTPKFKFFYNYCNLNLWKIY